MYILMKEANVKRLCKNYCVIPIIRHFWKRQNYRDSKKISDRQVSGGGRGKCRRF